MKWFYQKNENMLGPYSEKDLMELAKKGTLEEDDLVWFEGLQEWRFAKEVSWLKFKDSTNRVE